jgi:hypothetical protein
VPWHLTTREAMRDVRRVLPPEGVYVANLIDHGELDVAAIQAVMDERVTGWTLVEGADLDAHRSVCDAKRGKTR